MQHSRTDTLFNMCKHEAYDLIIFLIPKARGIGVFFSFNETRCSNKHGLNETWAFIIGGLGLNMGLF